MTERIKLEEKDIQLRTTIYDKRPHIQIHLYNKNQELLKSQILSDYEIVNSLDESIELCKDLKGEITWETLLQELKIIRQGRCELQKILENKE